MKAPDKIYVWEHNIEAGTIIDLGELCVQGSIEYIRKDFLIDKLARAKALRERSGSKDTEVIEALTNLIKEL